MDSLDFDFDEILEQEHIVIPFNDFFEKILPIEKEIVESIYHLLSDKSSCYRII